MSEATARLREINDRADARKATAKYVVMVIRDRERGNHSVLRTDRRQPDGSRAWVSPGDGFGLALDMTGIATLEDAVKECDDAASELFASPGRPVVVELPVRVRQMPPARNGLCRSYFDPSLSQVYPPPAEVTQ